MTRTQRNRPVGVFDSGVGGLSVLRAIRGLLPHEELIYVADSAHLPYGDKSREFVEKRAVTISEFLCTRDVKAIVVACNTATSAAVATLRSRLDIPVIGVEPALKPAAEKTRSGVVGVLATSGTLQGEKFNQLQERVAGNVKVLMQACHGWVEQVESGDLTSAAARELVGRYVTPLIEHGADTLVLGCTHYPFLAPLIGKAAGTSVSIIDPSPAVARELKRRLESGSLLSDKTVAASTNFWTSGVAASIAPLITRLWGEECEVERMPAEWIGSTAD